MRALARLRVATRNPLDVTDITMGTAEELAKYTPHSPTLLTLGVFDGVHLGHLSLIRTLREQAGLRKLQPGVVTFSPHPVEVLRPDVHLPQLTSVEERLGLLERTGVTLIIPLTFTRELSEYAPSEFARLLTTHLRMSGLVLGPDFVMGRDRAGTARALEEIGQQIGFTVETVPPYTIGGQVVSSTAIREALTNGDVVTAAQMLGRKFSLSGTIGSTSQRGASLGFPTANLTVGPQRALPRDGVYATIAHVCDGQFASVTNIGCRPTFGHTERIVETHILDFDRQIYGAPLTVEFVAPIRGEVTFRNPETLVAQIRQDVAAARQILGDSNL